MSNQPNIQAVLLNFGVWEEGENDKMIKKTAAIFALSVLAPVAWADADGNWDFTMSSPFGQVSAKVSLQTDGDTLTGEFDLGEDRILEIQEGKVEGNTLSFSITREGMMTMTYVMTASVDGDSVTGSAAAMGTTAPWSMTRSN